MHRKLVKGFLTMALGVFFCLAVSLPAEAQDCHSQRYVIYFARCRPTGSWSIVGVCNTRINYNDYYQVKAQAQRWKAESPGSDYEVGTRSQRPTRSPCGGTTAPPGGGGGGPGGNGGGTTQPDCGSLFDYPYYKVKLMGPRPGGNPQIVERFYYSSNGQVVLFCRSGADSLARRARSYGYMAEVEVAGYYRWYSSIRCSQKALSCNSSGVAVLVPNNGSYPLPN